jgi:hypothetical protein
MGGCYHRHYAEASCNELSYGPVDCSFCGNCSSAEASSEASSEALAVILRIAIRDQFNHLPGKMKDLKFVTRITTIALVPVLRGLQQIIGIAIRTSLLVVTITSTVMMTVMGQRHKRIIV